MGLFKRIKQRKQSQKANTNHNVPFMLERLEPRLLLSADLKPDVAAVAAYGLDLLGDRIETFLDGQELLDTRVPFIVQVQQEGDDVKNVAPTIGELFSVDVDFNGDNSITGNESELQTLDVAGNNNGVVDAGEFIRVGFSTK